MTICKRCGEEITRIMGYDYRYGVICHKCLDLLSNVNRTEKIPVNVYQKISERVIPATTPD